MPAGLQVWNAAGVLTLDTSDRTGVILGYRDSLPASGSLVDVGLTRGEPFYLTQLAVNWIDSKGFILPTVTISGTTLSWSGAGNDGQWRIVWGVR